MGNQPIRRGDVGNGMRESIRYEERTAYCTGVDSCQHTYVYVRTYVLSTSTPEYTLRVHVYVHDTVPVRIEYWNV